MAVLWGLSLASPAWVLGAAPAQQFTAGITPNAAPWAIAAGPDGNLWFTEFNGNSIGRITPSGTVTEFSTGLTPSAQGRGIAAGHDGNLWFTEINASKIGRITPSGTIHEFPTDTANARPASIAAGPDGNMWFTEAAANKIGRITPAGDVDEFPVTTASSAPVGIVAGPDGNLWFTEQAANRVGRITTTGAVTEFSIGLTDGAGLQTIAHGPDGNLWFPESNIDKIGRTTTGGAITEFSGLTVGARPADIATGPDGNLWFTENVGKRIGRITPAGAVTEFSDGVAAADTQLLGIAQGPDGHLWFADPGADAIGRIATDPPAPISGNLLLNPGFELGAPGAKRLTTVAVPGWIAIPNFTVAQYGGTDLPAVALSDQIGGGHGFAFGGPNADEQSHALQHVDVTRESAAIDDGRAAITLSGLLGGEGGQQDQAAVSAQFLSASGAVVASVQIGPVTAADRGAQTTLLARSASATLPAGTRAVRVVATATNIGGGSNNGYFDNLSLTMDVTPLPPTTEPPAGGASGGGATGTGSPAATPDTVAPAFRAARMTNKRFAVDTKAIAEVAVAALAKKGTAFVYTLSEASAVRFTIESKQKGRRVGTRCQKPSARNRTRKACTRWVKTGTFAQDAAAGANTKTFSGKIGRRKLKPGSYRATLSATDAAGNRSQVRRLSFKVVRR